MPSSTKVSKTLKAKQAKPAKSRVAKTNKVRSNKRNVALETAIRSNFVAVAVLVAAGLISISAGFSSTPRNDSNSGVSLASLTGDTPTLFLKTLNAKDAKAGSTLAVVLYENSGTQAVNTIQSAVQYPSEAMEVVRVTTAKHFTQEAATDTSTPGLIRIARAVPTDAPALTGVKPVAVIEFKLLKDPNAQKLGIDMLSSLLVRSSDNKNIL